MFKKIKKWWRNLRRSKQLRQTYKMIEVFGESFKKGFEYAIKEAEAKQK